MLAVPCQRSVIIFVARRSRLSHETRSPHDVFFFRRGEVLLAVNALDDH